MQEIKLGKLHPAKTDTCWRRGGRTSAVPPASDNIQTSHGCLVSKHSRGWRDAGSIYAKTNNLINVMRAAALYHCDPRGIASLVHHRNSIIFSFDDSQGLRLHHKWNQPLLQTHYSKAHSAHFPITLYSFHSPSSPDNITSILRERRVYSRSWRGRRCAGEGDKWQGGGAIAFIVSQPGAACMEVSRVESTDTHGLFTQRNKKAKASSCSLSNIYFSVVMV